MLKKTFMQRIWPKIQPHKDCLIVFKILSTSLASVSCGFKSRTVEGIAWYGFHILNRCSFDVTHLRFNRETLNCYAFCFLQYLLHALQI